MKEPGFPAHEITPDLHSLEEQGILDQYSRENLWFMFGSSDTDRSLEVDMLRTKLRSRNPDQLSEVEVERAQMEATVKKWLEGHAEMDEADTIVKQTRLHLSLLQQLQKDIAKLIQLAQIAN